MSEPCSSQLDLHYGSVFSLLDSELGFSGFFFPLLIEFKAVTDQRIGLYSQKIYHNQRVLRSSIYNEQILTSRD